MSEKKQRNDNLTDATDRDPVAWIDSLPTERQRTQGHAMLELFGDVTGAEAVMWGPSMVGYGGMHYTYDSGRQGNTFQIGFSPRKASLTLYGIHSNPEAAPLLEQLGPHKTSVACLYITNLAKIDLDVLRKLVEIGWETEWLPGQTEPLQS